MKKGDIVGKKKKARRADPLEALIERALELGASRAKAIPASSVVVGEWVRWKCQYGCGGYGRCLTCPPRSPAPEETKRALASYKRAILFQAGRGEVREIIALLEREVFLAGYYKAFGMASGPCRLCGECNLSGACRHPDEARPSMEACGVDVYATVRSAGWEIDVVRTEQDPARFFGLVLVD
jgi:predicted metal-binding protein